ncbi:MAG: DUF2769 domain-containing protein [Candidatus Falkowbacteria bacterium]
MFKVENTPDNLKKCACPQCPSYNECAKGKMELLYCSGAIGKSTCEYKMNGCTCGMCAVHKDCGLRAGYYCLHGSAEEIN